MANEIAAIRINMLDELIAKLYTSAREHSNRHLMLLIEKNSAIHKNTQDCFTFRREIFEIPGRTGNYPQPINTVSSEIRDSVKDHISNTEQTAIELALVKTFLQRVLAISHRTADYMAVTPTALHGIIKKFRIELEPDEKAALTTSEVEEFKHTNSKYLQMVQTRLTMNLINAP